MGKSFYTVSGLCKDLAVSRSKFYELVKNGLHPTLYIGSSPRWDEDTVAKWLSEQPTCRRGIVGGTI